MSKNEEELIRLAEIFETLRKDAIEVSHLLVRGIEHESTMAYVLILIGFFCVGFAGDFFTSGNLFGTLSYGLVAIFAFSTAVLGFYKHRKLKKKYSELIEIDRSLRGE